MLNFNKSYAELSWASQQIRWYRDWFLMWIAVAAYPVAQVEDTTKQFKNIPSWYSGFLETHPHFPQLWLSDFHSFIFDHLVTL